MSKTYSTDPSQIPPHMMAKLKAYIERGEPVGDFLQAVIGNNLKEACARADDVNIHLLHVYVIYLYNEAPALCWGSPEIYRAWIERKARLASGNIATEEI